MLSMWLVRSDGVNSVFHGHILIVMHGSASILAFRQLDNFVKKLQKKIYRQLNLGESTAKYFRCDNDSIYNLDLDNF